MLPRVSLLPLTNCLQLTAGRRQEVGMGRVCAGWFFDSLDARLTEHLARAAKCWARANIFPHEEGLAGKAAQAPVMPADSNPT